jgi:hypothetical protein
VNKTILDLGIGPIQNNSDLPPGLASSAVETAFSVMSANGTFRTCQPRQTMSGFRVKQSCRRNPETAEFDPLLNSPGRRKHRVARIMSCSMKRAEDRASGAIQ